MTSQFPPKVSEVLAFSREEAARLASRSVGSEHLPLGMPREKDSLVQNVFTRLNTNPPAMRAELGNRVRIEEINEPINASELVLNGWASNILKLAVLETRIQHTQTMDVHHLLLATLYDQANNGTKEISETNNVNCEDALTYLRRIAKPTSSRLDLPDEEEEVEFEARGQHADSSQSNAAPSTVT